LVEDIRGQRGGRNDNLVRIGEDNHGSRVSRNRLHVRGEETKKKSLVQGYKCKAVGQRREERGEKEKYIKGFWPKKWGGGVGATMQVGERRRNCHSGLATLPGELRGRRWGTDRRV